MTPAAGGSSSQIRGLSLPTGMTNRQGWRADLYADGMDGESFEGPSEFEANMAYPPQLCPDCGRPMSVGILEDEALTLVFRCETHGEQGTASVSDVLDQ